MTSADVSTIAAESEPLSRRARSETVLALCLAWSASEPARVGEIAIVPSHGRALVVGRGDGDGSEARARFVRQRGGLITPAPPLEGEAISRRQLLLRSDGTGIEVENVGRAALRINGERGQTGRLAPGDVLVVGRQLVLYCVTRPARVPAARHAGYPTGPFGEPDGCGLIGEAPAMWRLRDMIGFAAAAEAHALLLGESGTGKELTAQAIHDLSVRAGRALVSRNAATLPATLIDAELFGNLRNYPNPGMPERKGLIGEADGATLFLDEIGELSAELQAHLLRVLDTKGEYQRLGESTTRRSSFRLIAATNRDASALKGDLLPRFTLHVEVPALAERREDIPLIARHLVLRAKSKAPSIVGRFVGAGDGREEVRFDPHFVEQILRRSYPGNIRDLDGLIWRAMSESRADVIDPLHDESWAEPAAPAPARAPRRMTAADEPTVDAIREAMRGSAGSITEAARALGLPSRYALYRLLRKHGIEVDRKA